MKKARTSLLAGAALGFAGCGSLEAVYEKEVRAELAKPAEPGAADARFTEGAIAGLPEPVRRYLRFAGWVGREVPKNARLVWGDFRLKRGRDKPWMPLACRQFNAVREPARIVFMDGRLLKVLPFQGRDKYQDGHGQMRVMALGFLKVVDEASRKLDESALVTVLAEAMLVPGYILADYMRWEPIDSLRAKATLEWGRTTVSGIFHFSSSGEWLRFDTQVRWQQGADSLPVPWSAYAGGYGYGKHEGPGDGSGIRFPRQVSATWHEPAGEFEYALGTLERIEYDVREP